MYEHKDYVSLSEQVIHHWWLKYDFSDLLFYYISLSESRLMGNGKMQGHVLGHDRT